MLGNGAHKMNGNTTTTITTTTTTIAKKTRGKRPDETVFESIVKEKGRNYIANLYSRALQESIKRDPTFSSYR